MTEVVEKTKHATGKFPVSGGVSLFKQCWKPAEAAKAAIIIVHGHGEHSTRYDHIAERLNNERYSVFTYDQRGHGHSPGKPGYINTFKVLVDDLSVFVDQVRTQLDGSPLFLFGHSMGGLVLASYVLKYQPEVAGLIFSSSALKVGDDVAPIAQKLSGVLSTLTPWLPVHHVEPDAISRDSKEVEKYVNDPLVYHGKILARTGAELMNAMNDVQAHLNDLRLPFIALHGTGDLIVEPAGTKILYENAGSTDKTLKLYEGGYHEVFHDHDREQFLQDVIDWLNAHC